MVVLRFLEEWGNILVNFRGLAQRNDGRITCSTSVVLPWRMIGEITCSTSEVLPDNAR